MQPTSELHKCRICSNTDLPEVVNLGNQVITSRFPNVGDTSVPSGMIRLVLCSVCNLVQLKDSTPASEMYEHFYGYRSGINATMRSHLTSFNDELQTKVLLCEGDCVLDIGSNDCTFVGHYPDKVTRYGCDPTGVQFREFYTHTNTTLIPTYFTKEACQNVIGTTTRFKAVTSISMFYDLPDPIRFAKDIYSVLDDDGIWGLEQSYVATMLERNSIDTICHEHLEYYGVKQIKYIMDAAGFKIIDILLNECNGGSFRIYVAKKESTNYTEHTQLIDTFLQNEETAGIHTPERYVKFMEDCSREVEKLVSFINIVNSDSKKVYIYGASTKGNCLLQFANIDSSRIPFAVERNPLKIGRTTSTGIEIIGEDTMRADPPTFMLVLPWHFRKEIIEREKIFLENGGQLLFPFPSFEVYSSKPKTLITGIHGQIGHYVEKLCRKTDSLYGIVHTTRAETSALSIELDIVDSKQLEYILLLIRPDRIIHLASLSNTEDCERSPVNTLDINGRVVAVLCDSIHRNNIPCKLFNASSSEIYKGHIEYTVKDNDEAIFPSTMYGICKAVGHQIVNSYRNKYNLPFSNGVIFMSDSRRRDRTFLLKKIALHGATFKQKKIPITLGNLDSWRNLNHPEDVALAIALILDQEIGNTYVICNTNFQKVEDLVIELYRQFDIHLLSAGTHLYDRDTKEVVVHISSPLRNGFTKINGSAQSLRKMGWVPSYTTEMIMRDLANPLNA